MGETAIRFLPEGIFRLDSGDPEGLETYLKSRALLDGGERVCTASPAGAGNMNCVVRVDTGRRSFIVKQSRPWVEKYPQFDAPWDRACREMDFYRAVAGVPEVAGRMPRLLHADPLARLLILEDLGDAGDYSDLYGGGILTSGEVAALASFLGALHRIPLEPERRESLVNREMRELNHAHIFVLPLHSANGPDLERVQPGLQAVADGFKADASLVAATLRLGGTTYLADGCCLLHGDFFPGSFVRTPGGLRVIDPEFGFPGRPEFDVGVLLGHLHLAGQPVELAAAFLREYSAPVGFELSVAWQVAGVEIVRRLLGYAQLPVILHLEAKRRLLEKARSWILWPPGLDSACT